MATQVQATIESLNGSPQPSGTSMSFPINEILIFENGSGSVIEFGSDKFSSSDSIDSLVVAGLVQATVLQIGNASQISKQFLFPASKIAITSSNIGGANAAIFFNGTFYYVGETEDALVTAANAGGGGGTSLVLTDSNNVQWNVTITITGALVTTQV